MTTMDSEQVEYAKQVFDYEETAYTAAEGGDYAGAAAIWQAVLDDEAMRGCFSQEAQHEIAYNLALAYHQAGQEETSRSVSTTWQLSDEDQAAIYGSGESA